MEILIHEASMIPGSQNSTTGACCSKTTILNGKEKNGHDFESNKPLLATENGKTPVKSNGIGSPSFLNTTKSQMVDMIFENVTYTVHEGLRRVPKEILHCVSGRLLPNQLTAIMGPSGAGKSTLLDILSGYRITGVDGTIYVNGRLREWKAFRKSSAYIQQDDRLDALLTVIENMRFAADLKLSCRMKRFEKETIIEEVLTTLGLYEHMHTRADRLSGGQRKRLSIALELVNNPTVLFLDEPTTGLDSSSCTQVVNLLKLLAHQGRTVVCTIHQPSDSVFELFDQLYVLAAGQCLYQGTTNQLIPYLESVKHPCPMYHNPADFVIEVASGDYGYGIIDEMIMATENGRNLSWFNNPKMLLDAKGLRALNPLKDCIMHSKKRERLVHHVVSLAYQFLVLLRRSTLKALRDTTGTHIRIIVNILTGIMLGCLCYDIGDNGLRAINNYNLLFACLMHHMMSTMMLTVLTFPMQVSILQKEHFNRWYGLKMYYTAITIVDFPISFISCALFSVILYYLTSQPFELIRFAMFFIMSFQVTLVAQSFGLLVGAVCNVVNGTFLAPTLSVPLMMFAGFGVPIKDLPFYLRWGTHISYLKYALEGYIEAIYGMNRKQLSCPDPGTTLQFCTFKYVKEVFKSVIRMSPSEYENKFHQDVIALLIIFIILKIAGLYMLKIKLMSSR